jgi:methionine-rich copper-binding protein CopC
MKLAGSRTRKIRARDGKALIAKSSHARRRDAAFKLEALEERTLLSSKGVPSAPILPIGLGPNYTNMSEQAHGVGQPTPVTDPLGSNSTSTAGSSTATMADVEAYLKSLYASVLASQSALTHGSTQTLTGTGRGTPPSKTTTPSPVPGPAPSYYQQNQDNPQQEHSPVANVFDQASQLQHLAYDPNSTGFSRPPLNPTIINGFDGMNFLDSVNGYVPPDTDMAVGPQVVVKTVNAQIQFYDKATGQALLPNTPLNVFFNAPSESPFDPVPTYDEIAGRFVIAAPTFGSHMLFAVSHDSNPMDGFSTYDLDVSEGGSFSPDYPKIGWNADEVVITFNMYGPFGFDHVQVLSFAASSIFAASPPPTLTLGTDYFSADRFNNDFTMAAASMHGAMPGDPMYFVEENSFDNGSQMRVVSATNLLSNSPSFSDTVVPVDSYAYPPSAQQPGSFIQTNDTRILNAEWRDGLLVADQNVGLFTDSDAHARWYEFNVSGSPSLVQDGTISPAPGTSTYFPAITIAPGDIIGMMYNESSPTEFASVYDTGRTTADPLGTMETPALAKAGSATYADFAFRWGDYSGIGIDPTDGSIWTGGEYATSLLSGLPANWATWISHFSLAPTVVSSVPAAGSIVTGAAPTTFALTFSEPIDPTSITASDFTVDNTPADSASLSADGLTITYTYNTSPVTQEGTETMSLPAGSVKGASDETGNAAFSASFLYVQVQLQVSATSPAVGSILPAPVTDIVVQFNKDFNPYTISSSDFQVSQGSVVSATPLTSQAVDLTLTGVTHDGTLTLTVPAGVIQDTVGVGNLPFSGTYIVDITSAPYPVPVQGQPPAGSLIYDPSVTGAISFVGDTDTYTLPLAANQDISLVLTVDPSLIGTVTLLDPSNNVVGSATGAAPGQTVVLQTAPVNTSGTYSLVVGGSGGTTGNYTLQAILNAAYKQSTDSINSIGTAYDLSGAFVGLGTNPAADRAGVVGTLAGSGGGASAGPNAFGYTAIAVTPTFNDITATGTPTLTGTDDSTQHLDSSVLGSWSFQFYGNTYTSLDYSTNGLITFNGPDNSFVHFDMTNNPTMPSIAPYWTDLENFSTGGSVYYQVEGTQLIIQWNNIRYFCCSGTPINFEAVLDSSNNTIQFNYTNLASGQFQDNGAFESVGIKDDNGASGGADPLVVDYNSGPNAFVNSNLSTEFGVGLGITPDYYKVQLNAGQAATFAIKGIGATADIGLYDGSGNLLALSSHPGHGLDAAISDFVAQSSGTYYVKVSGAPSGQYDLVVTRDAGFTLHANSFNTAQQLNGANVVLGAIEKGGGALQALDLQAFAFSNIYQTDPVTGAFGTHITSPNNNAFYLFGQNMAFDGNFTYYNDGYGDTGTIYKLDSTGTVVGSFTPPNGFTFTGLAYLNGDLYANAAFDSNIYIFDATTFNFLGTINTGTGAAWTGLAGDPDRGVLWAVSQPGTLYEIDPSTGSILKQGPDHSQGFYQQDIAYANGELIVSDTNGFYGAGNNFLDEYDPNNLGFLQRVAPPYTFAASGLAGDGVGGQGTDWYQFNVNAGDNLVLTTTTPGGSTASGTQFINDLMPTLNLYDANGNLVATATGNAGDGRNDLINWTALSSGSYRVQIIGATKDTVGEYTIAIQGATGGSFPFTVVSTNPAAGSDINFEPTTMTVVVSDSIAVGSISPSDLTIDGQSATGVTVLDNHTLSFNLPAIFDGVHNVSIAGLQDIHGVALTPDNFSFTTDTVPPFIVSSSLFDGEVFSPAPQNISEVVTFSEPMNTAFTTSSAFDLFGTIRNVHYAAASFGWDPTGTILTIDYNNLPTDAYQFNLFASGFQDLAGNFLVSGLSINFSIVGGTSDITGLQPMLPLGSLVYQTTIDNLLVSPSDVDTYNLGIDPHQTISVLVTPVTQSMTATVSLFSPSGILIGQATSPSPGAPAVLPAVQSAHGGTYQIQISGGPGEYHLQPILNVLIDPAAYGGLPDDSIATAQPLDPYANRFAGQNDRMAVLGTLLGGGLSAGDAWVAARNSSAIEGISHTTGQVLATIPVGGGTLSDIALGSDGIIYAAVTTSFNAFSVSGELLKFDQTGKPLGAVQLPDDPNDLGFFYPFGFGVAPDNTFWVPQPNSGNIIHVDGNGNLLASYFIGGNTEAASVRSDGKVLISLTNNGQIDLLDPSTGSVSLFAFTPVPLFSNTAPTGGSWVGDFLDGGLRFDNNGNVVQNVGFFGTEQNQNDTAGNVWNDNFAFGEAILFDPNGNQIFATGVNGAIGLTVAGVDGPPPPPPSNPVYSFALNQGESATIAIQSLNGKNVSFSLLDDNGNVLAISSPGATNYTAGINNFVAQSDGTYYIATHGDGGAQFNLVVTRGADFTTQPHNTLATAQDITPTQQSGNSQQGGALGYLQNPSGAIVSSTIEGANFSDPNNHCGCLPPDTNAAVGGNYVAEIINLEFVVFDKTTGATLLSESTDTLFGQSTLSDPYIEYDAGVGRWYATVVGSADTSKVLLAISNDANPLDGFSTVFDVPLAASGDLADFPKFGYNADAIVIEANDFGNGHSVVTAVDKAQALAGTLVDYQSTPSFQFRALVPAQMHGSNPGDPMWFMAATGDPTYDGTTPNTIRVTRMDNILSNSPIYTDYTVGVNTYGPNHGAADQPNAPSSVATNDVTTTQVDYLNGSLVTAFSASTPADGFNTTKAHWYQVDVTGGSPTLVQEGLIDPGPGVATFFPTAAQDAAGNIGITYMESSSSEFVSSYVAGHIAGTPLGSTTAGTDFAPGVGSMVYSFREGDYSSVVLDPSDGMTFWAANEYSGPGDDNPNIPPGTVYHTRLASFTVVSGIGTDYYSVSANAGDNLHFATTTPAGGPLEFINNFYPELLLYDPNGNLVAIANGNASDGRNSVIDFTVPDGDAGTWTIEVTPSPSTAMPTQGEYGLLATGATGSLAANFVVTSTNPPDGALIQPPTDYIATFSKTVLGTSLTPGELTINGVPAIGVTLVDAHTVDWTIDPTSIPAGERVLNTAVISADANGQRVTDVSGAMLADFTSTFTTDTVAPTILSSSVNNGDLFSPAPYDLTEVVTFSEAMNTAFTTAASFDLHGNIRNADYPAASFGWDPTGTILTINYTGLKEDTYTLTLFAAGFQDLVGLPLASDFTVNFAVALGTAPFATPFTPIPPLGDLIYSSTDSGHILVTPTDLDSLTVNLNAGETLSLVGVPSDPSQQLIIAILDPSNTQIASATAPAAGANAVIETAPLAVGGVYTIQISDNGGALGFYSVQAYLNTVVKTGTANISIGTAIDLTGSSYVLGPGNADRLAVIGSIPGGTSFGDALVVESSDVALINQSSGQIVQKFNSPAFSGLFLFDVALAPDNTFYVLGDQNFFTGVIIHMNLQGQTLGTITVPVTDNPGFLSPEGFGLDPRDGSFWIPLVNSGNLVHIDSSGNFLNEYSIGGSPNDAAVGPDGKIYITQVFGAQVQSFDPTTGNIAFFAFSPFPIDLTWSVAGDLWVGDIFNGYEEFDSNGNFITANFDFGVTASEPALSGNIWDANIFSALVNQYDPGGNPLTHTGFSPFQPGLAVIGDVPGEETLPPPDNQDFYSFALTAGQSATVVVDSLNGKAAQITLMDGSGNVLATGVGGSTNVTQSIQNFVAGSSATYYVEVTGDVGVKYSLTVTRGSNFDIEPNDTPNTSQPLTGTNGVLGSIAGGGNLAIGTSFEGIDFNGSPCGCLPPDTNAAVGGNFVMETVNTQIRVFDKTTGATLLDESLQSFFGGQFSGGDPYVVYDDIANRWYVEGLDSSDGGFFFAVSVDANPLDGFLPTHDIANGLGGPITDYPKMGFNKDAIFISYNNFGSGGAAATVVSIDKNAALAGTLTYFVSAPPVFQFRAMPPAQMHGDTTGGVEWFVSTDGTDAGGNTIRVTELTNYLSNNPTYTLTSLPVAPYQSVSTANQPGGSWTTFPNTTTTEVQYRNGHLVTVMASGTAADGFTFPKGLYYQIDVSSGTPVLLQQGVIDPGAGVAVQMPSVAEDDHGNLGFTWMEGSSTEFVSMWVGGLDTSGHFTSFAAAPSSTFFAANFRIGDYSTTVVDPTDGLTFWSANEWSGPGADSGDIWNTHITSFSLPPAVSNDWYSINVGAGNTLALQSSTPSDQGGEFINTASLEIELYDPLGNLVATGTKLADGRNESLSYVSPITGQYHIRVFNDPGSTGEYFLSVNTPAVQAGGVSGQVFNDLTGSGAFAPGDPGLDNWEVDVFDSNNNLVAAQLTAGGGNFDIEGLAPGTYTVAEVLQSGWLQTAPPPPGTFTVTVTAGVTDTGLQFGNFQLITISGEKFNDLTDSGMFLPGDPGLPGWTIDLLNASGAIVASTVTDANGNYSFTGIGPGTYTVQEELQPGWIQTFPAPPGTYTVTATSGQNPSGLLFGNFQLVSYTGTVYDDLSGNGVHDPGDPGLQGWTVNLLDINGNIVATTTSDVNGNYQFANIGFGTWTIEEVNQNGWFQTQPVNPPGTYTFTATSGASQTGLDFGNFALVNVTGNVYNDQNGNGHRDPGEPGLQGWTVNLTDPAGNTVASTTSDANGNYQFDNLFPGTFTVSEILMAGWTQTQPVSPGVYTFATQSGMNETGLNFGNTIALSPVQVIDNGQAGYSETGTWKTVPGGYNGTNRLARNVHGGHPTSTATWDFFGVPNGTYDVYLTYLNKAINSTAAPFTVFDGGTNLGTQHINQSIPVTQGQGGRNEGSFGGVGWIQLGTYMITSGELKVQLTNLAIGSFVEADGMLFVNHVGASMHTLPLGAAGAATVAGNGGFQGMQALGADSSTSSSGNSQSTKPSVTIKGVTQPRAVDVVYKAAPPAQANLATTVIDKVLNSEDASGGSHDLIGTLATDVVSTKKRNA